MGCPLTCAIGGYFPATAPRHTPPVGQCWHDDATARSILATTAAERANRQSHTCTHVCTRTTSLSPDGTQGPTPLRGWGGGRRGRAMPGGGPGLDGCSGQARPALGRLHRHRRGPRRRALSLQLPRARRVRPECKPTHTCAHESLHACLHTHTGTHRHGYAQTRTRTDTDTHRHGYAHSAASVVVAGSHRCCPTNGLGASLGSEAKVWFTSRWCVSSANMQHRASTCTPAHVQARTHACAHTSPRAINTTHTDAQVRAQHCTHLRAHEARPSPPPTPPLHTHTKSTHSHTELSTHPSPPPPPLQAPASPPPPPPGHAPRTHLASCGRRQ